MSILGPLAQYINDLVIVHHRRLPEAKHYSNDHLSDKKDPKPSELGFKTLRRIVGKTGLEVRFAKNVELPSTGEQD